MYIVIKTGSTIFSELSITNLVALDAVAVREIKGTVEAKKRLQRGQL